MKFSQEQVDDTIIPKMELEKELVKRTKNLNEIVDELKTLKSLVGQFLKETMYVPFRAVDCDQDKVEELWEKLSDAIEKNNEQPN